ncbi:MAG: tRNA lysidine(34) synthetase TilS [Bacteroidetes bacterium]|nr:tRNA lysidine(34) synthetase TilS [Bacteroidota bacterium]
MPLLDTFIDFIKENALFKKDDYLILAVSGGLDSVILTHLCIQAKFDFEIAHCNFCLRGAESDRDEDFVRALAIEYQIPFNLKKFDTIRFAEEGKISTQVAARQLRYSWFDELIADRKKHNVSNANVFLATAHHANDDIETLLMNFFKGTGIKGLSGIPVKQGHIVRPLLFATREELKLFASINTYSFVEDSSNTSDKYTRNYFRNQLIPGIRKVFPEVENNLLKNLERFEGIKEIYEEAIEAKRKKIAEIKGDELHIPILKLQKEVAYKTLLYEIIKDYGFTSGQLTEALKLLSAENGKYITSITHRIIRSRNWLIIAPLNFLNSAHILIERDDRKILFKEGEVTLKVSKNIFKDQLFISGKETANLDWAKLQFPLILRPWKSGDYFYPFGMKHKKKLNKFFADSKLSITEREKIWVIESGKRIVWIVGVRIDDRFKILPSTKEYLRLQFTEL